MKLKLEVPIDINEAEINRIKNTFRTQLDYHICGTEIKKEKVILIFKYIGENERQETILHHSKTKKES